MKKCKVTGNIAYAGNGGGIYAGGALTMTECDVTDNQTGANGGGLCAMGTLAMEKCTLNTNKVNHNYASGGGAVFVYTNGTHTMKNCTLTGNEAEKGDGGGIYTMGTLTMEDCTLTGNTTKHGLGGGIYTKSTLIKMTGCTLTSNEATNNGNGGGVYVAGSGTFKMEGTACITPSTEADEDKMGKNDVYLEHSKTINIDDVLTHTGIVARITVGNAQYNTGTKVLDGTPKLLNSEHTKFTVTPGGTPQKNWKVNNQGRLEMKPGGGSSGKTINGADADAWKQLKEAVANAAADSTITILGEITATSAGTGDNANWGEITITRNITIKGNNKNNDILNANKTTSGKAAHRIFVVKNGATLTLKNLKLKNGKAPSGAHGGAILVPDGGGAELSDCTIEDCETGNGGSGGVLAFLAPQTLPARLKCKEVYDERLFMHNPVNRTQ